MLYNNKAFFGGKMSIEGAVAYMLWIKDFRLELTAKYTKEYNGLTDKPYGNKYENVLENNIKNKNYDNLQIYYCGREGGKHKGKKLVEKYIEYIGKMKKN